MDSTGERILQEISGDDVQKMLDDMAGSHSFNLETYIGHVMNGDALFSFKDMGNEILHGISDNILHQKDMYVYLIGLAVMGALITNFSRFLQGKKVADTAFYVVYMMFFSTLTVMFTQFHGIATDILTKLLDFIKVFSVTFFMCMTFSNGGEVSAVYYEFTLLVMTVINYVLVNFIMPAIEVFFFLKIADQISEEDMFSKMASLIKDVIQMAMKMMFGVVMGVNVVQGLIVPVTSEMKNSMLVRVGSMVPGIGSTVSSVAQTVLSAGKLVKNAVGVAGIIAVVVICLFPLLKLAVNMLLYRFVSAIIQPISDKRVLRCFDAVAEAMGLQIYAVGTGCMMFVISIAMISAMT